MNHMGAKHFNWSAFNNGIRFDEPYSINGNTYFLLTAPEAITVALK